MFFFFFYNNTATTEIYTLSLHDALPISRRRKFERPHARDVGGVKFRRRFQRGVCRDRKSTRLNSSHAKLSYAVFCLKTKNIPQLMCATPTPETKKTPRTTHRQTD